MKGKVIGEKEVLEQVSSLFCYSLSEKEKAIDFFMDFLSLSKDSYLADGKNVLLTVRSMLHQFDTAISERLLFFPQKEALATVYEKGLCIELHLKDKTQSMVGTLTLFQQRGLGISLQKPEASYFSQLVLSEDGEYHYSNSVQLISPPSVNQKVQVKRF